MRPVGKMVLNRNPDNFFAETEQVAFHTANVVPGIDFTNDPLLQVRLFSYQDTQLTRLGSPNFSELPINRPLACVANHQRDAHMRHTINKGRVAYAPASLDGHDPAATGAADGFHSHAVALEGRKLRERSPSFDRMWRTCSLTVSWLMPNDSAIALLLLPFDRCSRISRSRSVSDFM